MTVYCSTADGARRSDVRFICELPAERVTLRVSTATLRMLSSSRVLQHAKKQTHALWLVHFATGQSAH